MQLQCSAGNLPKIETELELQAFEARSSVYSLSQTRRGNGPPVPSPGLAYLYLLPLYLHLLPLKVQTQLTNTA